MMKLKRTVFFLAHLFLVAGIVRAGSLPPGFDATFGGSGVVRTDFGPDLPRGDRFGEDLAIQTDGKLIVAGFARDPITDGFDFTLTRFLPNGSIDEDFGTAGSATTDIGQSDDFGEALTLQADGKILVAGSAGSDFALVRYLVDGSLDGTFSADGKVTTDFGTDADAAWCLVVQGDGKILVAGEATCGICLARYNSDGSLDASFGTGGKVSAGFGCTVRDIALQTDGKIVVVGSDGNDFAIARFLSDGSADTSFSEDGFQTSSFGAEFSAAAEALALLPDGKVIVIGTSAKPGESSVALARYLSDGTLDLDFSDDGLHTSGTSATSDLGHDIEVAADGTLIVCKSSTRIGSPGGSVTVRVDDYAADTGTVLNTTFIGLATGGRLSTLRVQPDGKAVLTGHSYNGSNKDFLMVRFDLDRDRDLSFAGDGSIGLGDLNYDTISDIAIQPDGRIVVAGTTITSSLSRVAVARYNADGSPDTSFSGDGKTTVRIDPFFNFGSAMALQDDGKILVAGRAGKEDDEDIALVRLNPDGSLDMDFSVDGWVRTDLDGRTDRASALVLLADGKIMIAGSSSFAGALARYHSDGTLDPTFSGNGWTITTDPPEEFGVRRMRSLACIAIQGDGKILAGGRRNTDLSPIAAMVRYLPDGEVDSNFGFQGLAGGFPSVRNSALLDLAVQPDGKIVVAGNGFVTTADDLSTDFVMARNLPTGARDLEFGDDPYVATGFERFGQDFARSLQLLDDGRILLAGCAERSDGATDNFALALYLPDGSLDTSFFEDGKFSARLGDGDARAYCHAPLSDGKILVGGYLTSENGDHDFAILRIDPNSKPERTILAPGGSELTVDADQFDFGRIATGSSSEMQTFTVRNDGNALLENLEVTIDVTVGSEFTLDVSHLTHTLECGAETTFVVVFSPETTGDHQATINVSIGTLGTGSFDITLNGTGLSQLEAWRLQHFGSPADSGDAADGADPDQDGLTNFEEFTRGLDPNSAELGAARRNPEVSHTGFYIRLIYYRSNASLADGIDFSIEQTQDLGRSDPWTASTRSSFVLSDDGTVQRVRWQRAAVDSEQTFLRLRASAP